MSHTFTNTTNNILRSAPYWDDFYEVANTTTNELRGQEFDFHRVLFRPRFGVQSRELTQLQTLLQAQVERLGDVQFRNGDRVVGAQLTIDTKATSGLVLADTVLVQFFDRDTNQGRQIVQSDTATRKAKTTQYVAIDEQDIDSNGNIISNNYLIFQYAGADTFEPGAVLVDTVTPEINATLVSNTAQAFNVFSPASTISIAEGVMYVSGLFVRVRPQTITLDPLTNTPSFRVGMRVDEQILDEMDDVVGTTLLDPANNNAVGAHRFRIRLTLVKKSLTDNSDTNFIEIARIVNGVVQYTRTPNKYIRSEELSAILARRTYDESGDYIVRNFKPVVTSNPDDLEEQTFNLAISAGKAYVRGYEIESTDTTYLAVRKGTDTQDANNRSIPLSVGNFVYVSRVAAANATDFFANTGTVDLHCVHTNFLNAANTATYGQSKIGSAKVRMLETYEVPPSTAIGSLTNSIFANNTVYKLFFFDADFSVNASGNVVSATSSNTVVTLTLERVSGSGAYANGLPHVNNAIDGATIILGGTNSPVSGAFTVNTYLTDAAANANLVTVELREGLAALPNANTTYQIVFQTRDADAFATFNSGLAFGAPYTSNLAFQADVTTYSKEDGYINGWTRTEATTDNALLYQLPESFIKANTMNTDDTQFTTWVPSSADGTATLLSAANATFTVTFPTGDGAFIFPTGSISATLANRYFIVQDVTADQYGRGQILQFSDNANSSVRCLTSASMTGDTLTATYCHGAGSTTTTRALRAFVRTVTQGYPIRTKTLIEANTTHALANTTEALLAGQIEYTTLNVATNFAYSLKTPDVISLKVLYHANGSAAFSNTEMSTATDVTEYFTLDNGQRDNTYEYARAIVKPGASTAIAPTGRLLFIFDWFQHSGIGYATVDSYFYANSTPYTYDNIPSYQSTRTNRVTSLRNTLDFRPVRSNYDFQNAQLVLESTNTATNTSYTDAATFSTTFGQAYLIPVSDDVWIGSYSYYLGRIDKIALHPDGIFHVTEGQPATSPKPPAEDNNGLLMYQLTIPPYTLTNANGVPTTVRVQTFDHKRYTMTDITKIENRVTNLEYYTALSQLERLTRDQSVPDPTDPALQRFKNGFITDAFAGLETADWQNLDFRASVDLTRHTLRPAYTPTFLGFYAEPPGANSTSYGVTRIGDMIIPSYSTEAFITQTQASTTLSVNPFNIKGFFGTITLSPSLDQWKSVTSAPAQVIDMGGPTVAAANSSFTVWNDWQTTWFGVTNITPQRERSIYTPPDWDPIVHPVNSMGVYTTSWQDVETTTRQQRNGTQFNFGTTSVTETIGNRVIDTSIIPSIRERDVVFTATGIKPGASLYAFFDKKSVQNYVQRANVLKLYSVAPTAGDTTEQTMALVANGSATVWEQLSVGSTIYVKKPVCGLVSAFTTSNTITGDANSVFDYELTAGQLVRVEQGATIYDAYVVNVTSANVAVLSTHAIMNMSGATLSLLTPVTIAGIAKRPDGSNTEYTLSVVRANRVEGDSDQVAGYQIVSGALRPQKMLKDTGTSTNTASVLLTLASGYGAKPSINVKDAIIRSGVVRAFDSAAKTVRLDLDVTDSLLTTGTNVYFVGGPGAGQVARISLYSSTTQTITLQDAVTGIVAGETIYSIGELQAESFKTDTSVSGYAGTVAGVLHLQDGQFATGERIFRLTDDASDLAGHASTIAEAKYVATGLAVTEQTTSITSRYVDVTSKPLAQTRVTTSVTSTTPTTTLDWVDPVAETFLISAAEYPSGVMISSVDLVFANRPSTEVPVFVEIRSTNNGYPTTTVVPCVAQDNKASVMRYPESVTVVVASDMATAFSTSKYTRFTFPSLVHLLPGEYALVVRSDSDEYEVWTAVQGATPAGGTGLEPISKQPYAGVLFKSQNGSTWTASQDEDLTFRLNRAVWDAPTTGAVILRAQNPEANTLVDAVTFYPRTVQFSNTTSASYTMYIKAVGAGSATAYSIMPEIEYALANRSLVQGQAVGQLLLPEGGANAVSSVKRSGGTANTIDIITTLTTTSTDVAPYLDMKQVGLLGITNNIDDMSIDAEQISTINRGVYPANTVSGWGASTTASSPVVTGGSTTFDTVLLPGDDVIVGGNLVVTVASVTNATSFIATQTITETRVLNSVAIFDRVPLQFSTSDVGTTPTLNVQTNYARVNFTTPGTNLGAVTSLVVNDGGSGYITAPTVTAVYALACTQAVFAMTGETTPTGGSANTRYITKQVTLADGFDAKDIRVWFDGYRPVGTNFYVYYKVLASDASSARFEDQSWRLMPQETPDTVISDFPGQYREFAFKTPADRAYDQTTDTSSKFKVFAVKIVLASSNPTVVPSVRNFRAIALDS